MVRIRAISLCLGIVWDGKWNSTVTDVIDIREKSKNVLYKKVKNFVF
jgi:hypothetical protein